MVISLEQETVILPSLNMAVIYDVIQLDKLDVKKLLLLRRRNHP